MPDRETVPALFEPDSRRPSALAFVDSVHTVRLPLSALGRTVELSVAQIRGSQGGSEPLRTMYLTDANTSFSVTVSVASVLRMGGELAPLCIVGLGYDVGDVFNDAAAFERWHQQRVDDYLPAGAEVPGAPTMRGNAERFREALFDEIVPFVESNFPVSATDRIIRGNSLGGLFGLFSFLTRPGVFRTCAAVSPAIPFFEAGLGDVAAQLRQTNPDFDGSVHLLASSDDLPGFAEATARLATRLGSLAFPRLRVTIGTLEGESHLSGGVAAVGRVLRQVAPAASRAGAA